MRWCRMRTLPVVRDASVWINSGDTSPVDRPEAAAACARFHHARRRAVLGSVPIRNGAAMCAVLNVLLRPCLASV